MAQVVGWLQSVSHLRGSVGAVYDVTVAYHDYAEGERPSEVSNARTHTHNTHTTHTHTTHTQHTHTQQQQQQQQ
jgi:hypothetical protein